MLTEEMGFSSDEIKLILMNCPVLWRKFQGIGKLSRDELLSLIRHCHARTPAYGTNVRLCS